ncbi:dUTP diphosphatase [Patescibacteria group bacterium]|nr:dUTP diphosphatase [Patescibacteria group bacterium]
MKIKIQRLSPEMKLPKYARADDAGLDLFSCEDYTIQPKTRHTFSLGFALELPRGYVSLIWDKSGLASKQGLTTLGGVIEWSYRGEYKLILHNTSDQPYDVKKGDKLAQMLIQPVESVTIEEVDKLSDTERGSGGFGSTGR